MKNLGIDQKNSVPSTTNVSPNSDKENQGGLESHNENKHEFANTQNK